MIESIFERFKELLLSEIGYEYPVILHRPVLGEIEKKYVDESIDSNFVSSVGVRVTEFEDRLAEYTGASRAVATVNGTAALHIALVVAGVERDSEVITQPLSFIATANAISYTGAVPSFVDVERDTLGMDPDALEEYIKQETRVEKGAVTNKRTGRRISACVPVHIYGHPCRIKEISEICESYGIPLVEDAAEGLGSFRNDKHVGREGLMSTISFNGNKIVTTGGGGVVLTDDDDLADRLKHVTTTAKRAHKYEFFHDEIGYNYRLPNLNAALGCAQLDQLSHFIDEKRKIADTYRRFFEPTGIEFVVEPNDCRSNYWLNSILFPTREEKDSFLEISNRNGVMTRPFWNLLSTLPMFSNSPCAEIPVAEDLFNRGVALPSSVPFHTVKNDGGI